MGSSNNFNRSSKISTQFSNIDFRTSNKAPRCSKKTIKLLIFAATQSHPRETQKNELQE